MTDPTDNHLSGWQSEGTSVRGDEHGTVPDDVWAIVGRARLRGISPERVVAALGYDLAILDRPASRRSGRSDGQTTAE